MRNLESLILVLANRRQGYAFKILIRGCFYLSNSVVLKRKKGMRLSLCDLSEQNYNASRPSLLTLQQNLFGRCVQFLEHLNLREYYPPKILIKILIRFLS